MKKNKISAVVMTTFALLTLNFSLVAQTARNPLPRTINIPDKNHISPSLSGDGKHMVFVSNYSSSGKMALKYSFQTSPGVWSEPEELTNVNQLTMDFIGGHWLSYDGGLLFFTSKRNPSMGGYDIFFSERKGSYWTPPQNLGKPVNSESNDGHPSLSPDGRYLYFMRCNDMDNTKSAGCELYVVERKSDKYWHEPQKLPYPINTGDESTPRIMPDGETLVFASKRPGGKGGYDLYQSKLTHGQWTPPLPCDYLNTINDDLFVSVPAHGELAFYSTLFRERYTIINAKIPEELKPKKVAMIQGSIREAGSGKSLEGVAQVYNARTKEMEQFVKTKADGSFFVLVKGDDIYDFSISAKENHHVYFSRIYNLQNLEQSLIEELDLTLKPCRDGIAYVAEDILFEPFSANIAEESEVALLRLTKLLKDNRGTGLQIAAYLPEFRSDTIPDSDLTEMIVDIIYFPVDSVCEDTAAVKIDTISSELEDLTEFEESEEFEEAVDVWMEPANHVDSIQTACLPFSLKYTYHNDRTEKQAASVMNRLIELGVPPHLVHIAEFRDLESRLDASDREKLRQGSIVLMLDVAY